MTSFNPIRNRRGWTLVELISVIILVSILSTVMIGSMDFGWNTSKGEMTQQRLEAIKKAILGADSGETNEGKRRQFGFVGDIGRLPANLGELTTQGLLPSFAYNTAYGVGAGWRGPYVSGGDNQTVALGEDGWGRALTYVTTGTPTLRSLGSDGAVGGTVDATDLELTIPDHEWRGTVTGNLRDTNVAVSGAAVEIRYPVSGVLTAVVTTTDSNGFFQFNSVPFGARSLRVLAPVALGPSVQIIDRSRYVVPDTAFNYFGGNQGLSVQPGTAYQPTNNDSWFAVQSTHNVNLQLVRLYADWTGPPGTLNQLVVNGIVVNFTGFNRGETHDIGPTIVIPANSQDNEFRLNFSLPKNGHTITLQFYWLGRTQPDTIVIVNP